MQNLESAAYEEPESTKQEAEIGGQDTDFTDWHEAAQPQSKWTLDETAETR